MTGGLGSVWLVGLSGAGKSTVGRALAARLGFPFVDLDERVEALAGTSIADIFRRGGEARFRALEAEATETVARLEHAVVATGGGWMAREDIERNGPGRVRVWLRVRPETAIHRVGEVGVAVRPLLASEDPEADLVRLLAQREAAYAEAEVVVDTDGLAAEHVLETAMAALQALNQESKAETGAKSAVDGEIEKRT